MVDTATAKYLNDNIGGVLSKAMAEMTIAQPSDGVEFLSKWLKTHAEQEEAKAWREKEEKTLEQDRAAVRLNLETKEAKQAQILEEKRKKDQVFQGLLTRFGDPDVAFTETLWSELVDVAKMAAGADAAYLGIVDEEGLELDGGSVPPIIRYDCVSAGHEWMTERVLPKDTGVTWGSLAENPPKEDQQGMHLWIPPDELAPPPPVVEGEDPPEAKPTLPFYPVYVERVTDVEKIHFFDMTRFGSYLAVPLVYPSYYTNDALADAKQFETEKREAALKKKEEEEAAAAAAVEAEAAAAADPAAAEAAAAAAAEAAAAAAEVEPEPVKEMILRGMSTKLVLCLDTLGRNAAIDINRVEDILTLCKACATCKSRTEAKQVQAQAVIVIDEERAIAEDEQVEKSSAEAEKTNQELCEQERAAFEDIEGEEDRVAPLKAARDEHLKKKYDYLRAKQVFFDMKDKILELKTWVVVPEQVVNVIASIAFMCGYTKEQVYPRKKSILKWEKVKTLLSEELFGTIDKADVIMTKKNLIQEQKLSAVLAMCSPAEFDDAKAREVCVAFQVVFQFIHAACDFRTSYVILKKVQDTKERADAEETGEAFSGQPLSELDDDFED